MCKPEESGKCDCESWAFHLLHFILSFANEVWGEKKIIVIVKSACDCVFVYYSFNDLFIYILFICLFLITYMIPFSYSP